MFDWPAFLSPDARIDFWTILVGIISNSTCAVVGCFLVLKRMCLLGDAISHSVLAGIALAFLFSGSTTEWPMFIGALFIGLLTSVLTQTLHTFGQVGEDSSMGVVFTSLFALGVILIGQFRDVHLDTDCVLYGGIDTVALDSITVLGREIPRVLRSMVPVLAITVLFVGLLWKELKISAFDPVLSSAMGIGAATVHFLFMGLVSVVTVSSLQAVGAIVVVAMLIVPAATAHLLTDRLSRMIAWAIAVGVVSAIGGCLLARNWNVNAAGMMAAVAGFQFFAVAIVAPRYGIVSKFSNNFRLSLRIVTEDVIAVLFRLEEGRNANAAPVASREQCIRFAGGGMLARLAIPLLRTRGLIELASGKTLQLTQRGRELGESLVRSHRLWEAFLDENFQLPADHLHEPASRIEHYIGPELQDRLAEAVERRDVDPHGKTIPGGSKSAGSSKSTTVPSKPTSDGPSGPSQG